MKTTVDEAIIRPRQLDRVVSGVLLVVVFIYSAVLFNVIVPFYGYSTSSGVAHLVFLSATTFLGLAQFLTCVLVNPGYVPPSWTPDPEQTSTAAVVQVKRSGDQRWCKKCSAAKPPRAHHCRRCGRCVLRMDHHCVWINNCVGHGNYRAFFQMVFFLATASAHATALLITLNTSLMMLSLGWDAEARLLAEDDTGPLSKQHSSLQYMIGRHIGWRGAFWSHVLLQLLATAVAIPLTLSLFTLLVWNFNLLSQNKTTIEHHEGVAAKLNAAAAVVDGGGGGGNSGGAKVGLGVRGSLHHPWDLGDWHSNVAVTFGEEVTDWVVPWRGAAAEGDGVGYKTKWDD